MIEMTMHHAPDELLEFCENMLEYAKEKSEVDDESVAYCEDLVTMARVFMSAVVYKRDNRPKEHPQKPVKKGSKMAS